MILAAKGNLEKGELGESLEYIMTNGKQYDPEDMNDQTVQAEEVGCSDAFDCLSDQELELLRCLKIIRGALQVLRAFHETGYLHLDVSPDNILLIRSA